MLHFHGGMLPEMVGESTPDVFFDALTSSSESLMTMLPMDVLKVGMLAYLTRSLFVMCSLQLPKYGARGITTDAFRDFGSFGTNLTPINRVHSEEGIAFKKYYQSLRILTAAEEEVLGRYAALGRELAVTPNISYTTRLRGQTILSWVARQLLVAHNMRFVDQWTRIVLQSSTAGHEVSYYELLLQGIVGLGRAAERYDSRKGYRFLTYAQPWVMRELLHGLTTLRSGAFLSPQNIDICMRAHKARARLAEELQRLPTEQEVAEAVGVTPPRLQSLLFDARTKRTIISAHSDPSAAFPSRPSGTSQESTQTYLDVFSSTLSQPAEAVFASTAQQESQLAVQTLLAATLSALEMRTLSIRYGLLGRAGRPRSVEATAELMCMSSEGVRKVLLRAQQKLRHASSIKHVSAPADASDNGDTGADRAGKHRAKHLNGAQAGGRHY